MKKSVILLLIFSMLATFNTGAQDVESIIEKHIQAHGGLEKCEAVKSMKITGQFTSYSLVKKFITYKASPGLFYSEYSLGKHDIVEAFNGESGWTIDPWQDFDFPRGLNSAEKNVLLQKAEFCTPFFNYKQKGSKVEFSGKENIDDLDVLVLKLTRNNNLEETWYLDAKTFLEYKYTSQWIDFAWPSMAETYFDDFREVDGLILPYYIERSFNSRHRVTEIETIELNVDFDENLLQMPRNKEMLKLKHLIGKWDVVVDVMTRRGTWYTIDSTTSVIDYKGTNIIQEDITYDRMFPQPKINTWTYSSQTKNYRMTVYNGFHSTMLVLEGDFDEDSFVTDNTKISFGDTTDATVAYSQYSISQSNEDSFVVEIKYSADKGVTWMPRDKLTYTRRKD